MNTPVIVENDDDTSEIPSLLTPMFHQKLVLPTVNVAEMVSYQLPQTSPNIAVGEVPVWYLGDLSWRGINVPMISYEAINGEEIATVQSESQIVILNNTGVNSKLPFFCMPTQGIPRLSRIAMNEISENKQALCREYDLMLVSVAGEKAVIPDISKLEEACADMLGYSR